MVATRIAVAVLLALGIAGGPAAVGQKDEPKSRPSAARRPAQPSRPRRTKSTNSNSGSGRICASRPRRSTARTSSSRVSWRPARGSRSPTVGSSRSPPSNPPRRTSRRTRGVSRDLPPPAGGGDPEVRPATPPRERAARPDPFPASGKPFRAYRGRNSEIAMIGPTRFFDSVGRGVATTPRPFFGNPDQTSPSARNEPEAPARNEPENGEFSRCRVGLRAHRPGPIRDDGGPQRPTLRFVLAHFQRNPGRRREASPGLGNSA
jgi:hypothetical protein